MSAAIVLGKPVLFTRVPWNEKNIQSIKDHLLSQTNDPVERALIEEVYGSPLDLSHGPKLIGFEPYFAQLIHRVANLTDSMFNAAVFARHSPYLAVLGYRPGEEKSGNPTGRTPLPGRNRASVAPLRIPTDQIRRIESAAPPPSGWSMLRKAAWLTLAAGAFLLASTTVAAAAGPGLVAGGIAAAVAGAAIGTGAAQRASS